MLMLALASAENIVADTPFRLAICCPTAARMQQLLMCSTWWMRPARMASENLYTAWPDQSEDHQLLMCSVTPFSGVLWHYCGMNVQAAR